MTQIATVERIINASSAEISVPRKSACGHDCEECAGCGMTGAAIRAVARNTVGAREGQKVVVQSSTKNLLKITLVVYLLPIVLFMLGYFLTDGLFTEAARYIIAIVSFLLGIIPAVVYDRRVRKNGGLSFEIVRTL